MSEHIQHPGKVLVAMSGGVDSSVSAALLLEQGYTVIGVTLRFLPGDQGDAVEVAAQKAAHELGIELHVEDCHVEFERRVIQPFCDAYLHGSTPNPCVECNREFKFGFLLRFAHELGCDFLATGHYAKIIPTSEGVLLARGADSAKDQSYFMFCIADMDLTRVLFPLGEMNKEQVRSAAQRFGLSAQSSSESQDICFVPDNDYKGLVQNRGGDSQSHSVHSDIQPGEIVHVDGTVLGQHRGVHAYTVGQRRGLGVAWHEPLYVVRLDAQHKQVVVGEKEYLYQERIRVSHVVWGVNVSEVDMLKVGCQIRYRQQPVDAVVSPCGSDAFVTFDAPQGGISPGQAAVFYRGETVLGGGWIC
ncbi:MAG: tRNA 2-thiouridine(34) synthase MnmA [Desulfuromonadaceae bacterium]|nr:tRNA 2-thiouridine(34) synthase MnmA [Geobacteraceae bacterium]